MELTRRDALAVLAGAGILGGGGAAALARDGFGEGGGGEGESESDTESDADPNESDRLVGALVVTARAVYPNAVENTGPFVETYAATKLDSRPAFRTSAVETLDALDAEARITFDTAFGDLKPTEAETVLRRVGADTAEPGPEGTTAERVRYYFVNEVLYALYTSPTGGELVGIENPQGHPGGADSYRRGPDR
jgi:hypothetical protein